MQKINTYCPEAISANANSLKSPNDKGCTSEAQTPVNDNVVVRELLKNNITDNLETDDSSDPFLSDANTQKTDSDIPLKVETMTILSSMLIYEDFETGISNNSEKYFRHLLKEDPLAAMNGISLLFMDNYSIGGHKENILIGILHIISHLEYERVYPQGQMMAISALSHSNREVEEYGIKCFEDWGHRDGIEKLRAIKFTSNWLQEYAEEVIKDLSAGE